MTTFLVQIPDSDTAPPLPVFTTFCPQNRHPQETR